MNQKQKWSFIRRSIPYQCVLSNYRSTVVVHFRISKNVDCDHQSQISVFGCESRPRTECVREGRVRVRNNSLKTQRPTRERNAVSKSREGLESRAPENDRPKDVLNHLVGTRDGQIEMESESLRRIASSAYGRETRRWINVSFAGRPFSFSSLSLLFPFP